MRLKRSWRSQELSSEGQIGSFPGEEGWRKKEEEGKNGNIVIFQNASEMRVCSPAKSNL